MLAWKKRDCDILLTGLLILLNLIFLERQKEVSYKPFYQAYQMKDQVSYRKIYLIFFVTQLSFTGFTVNDITYITKEGWLHKWSELIDGSRNLGDFPVWLQFFVKVLFQVINRSGKFFYIRVQKYFVIKN